MTCLHTGLYMAQVTSVAIPHYHDTSQQPSSCTFWLFDCRTRLHFLNETEDLQQVGLTPTFPAKIVPIDLAKHLGPKSPVPSFLRISLAKLNLLQAPGWCIYIYIYMIYRRVYICCIRLYFLPLCRQTRYGGIRRWWIMAAMAVAILQIPTRFIDGSCFAMVGHVINFRDVVIRAVVWHLFWHVFGIQAVGAAYCAMAWPGSRESSIGIAI